MREQMRVEGKDRTELVREFVSPPATICVFGCSWGYELLSLRRAGYRAFGVELSSTRREFGRKHLGLPIFPHVRAVPPEYHSVDVVLSSHVLEHIPALDEILSDIVQTTRPRLQLHITPSVESIDRYPHRRTLIGREHPIGVTRRYWERAADLHRQSLEFRESGDEALAILRPTSPKDGANRSGAGVTTPA